MSRRRTNCIPTNVNPAATTARIRIGTRSNDAAGSAGTWVRQQVLRELPIAAATVPVLYLPGPAPVMISPLDFRHTPTLVKSAYDAARAFLDTLHVAGPGLYRNERSTPTNPTPSLNAPGGM